jgi:hypothetical protein
VDQKSKPYRPILLIAPQSYSPCGDDVIEVKGKQVNLSFNSSLPKTILNIKSIHKFNMKFINFDLSTNKSLL